MDQDNAATLEAGPDAGLLRLLGSHLVDQMLWLLGPAGSVYAELDHAETAADARPPVHLVDHAPRWRSLPGVREQDQPYEDRELRACTGSAGWYVAHGTDVQAQAVFAGRRPVDEGDDWGYEVPDHWDLHIYRLVPFRPGGVRIRTTTSGSRLLCVATGTSGARGSGRSHPRGARRRSGQRRREPGGRPHVMDVQELLDRVVALGLAGTARHAGSDTSPRGAPSWAVSALGVGSATDEVLDRCALAEERGPVQGGGRPRPRSRQRGPSPTTGRSHRGVRRPWPHAGADTRA